MKNVKDLKEKEIILCITEEECEAIAELLDREGFRWCDGDSYIESKVYDSVFDGNFAFNPYYGVWLTFTYTDNNYTIHKAKDFLPTSGHKTFTTDPTKQVLQEIIKEWHESKMEKSLINLIRERL